MSQAEPENIVDPHDAALSVGLRYVTDAEPGITRRRSGEGWRYTGPDGEPVTDPARVKAIDALAVPPAYTDVWICPDPDGHLQATGRDARGRKQYRYHPRFREVRDGTKYEHMIGFAHALPRIRARVGADLRRHGLGREKVLATVVHLLETTMIRVGNADYARHNESYGLTTLEHDHVDVHGAELRFHFRGKSGKQWNLKVRDRRVASVVKASQDLPGEHLFQYLDEHGHQHSVTSGDVNAYLRGIAGADVTAKDFRTWTGTVLAALALVEFEKVDSHAAAKRNVRDAIERVSARLGNTPAVCRKCYVHPEVLDSYLSDELVLEVREEARRELAADLPTLKPEEALVLSFLERRLAAKPPA